MDWTVLFIGGPSGAGKSSIAYELARHYGVNVVEADDIHQALEAMMTAEQLLLMHYWKNGRDWRAAGADENVKWLRGVGCEMMPALKAVAERHIVDDLPVIIEGDFIHPELAMSFESPRVKTVFIVEAEKEQLIKNYLAREGGEEQSYRAEISVKHGNWLKEVCGKAGIPVIEARPWETAKDRVIESLS